MTNTHYAVTVIVQSDVEVRAVSLAVSLST
jgi:hypothetical protein